MSSPKKSKSSNIKDRAKEIVKSAYQNDMNGVISIFENLCVPFNDNSKRKLFEELFSIADIEHFWDDNVGIVVPSKRRTVKTIVSHMDLIYKFNKGFSKNKNYEIKENKLYGALDNTFTNAVLINSILNNQNIETSYLFTLDEETNQKAMKSYMKKFGTKQFIINLDITNDGFDNNMSIEYDKPSWEICKQIDSSIINPFFTTERECDDLDQVMKVNGNGFSYCLPSGGEIHSYSNYTHLNKIKPYMDGLEYLIHELSLDTYEHNVNNIKIHKAIRFKSFNEFKEKDIVKRNYSIDSSKIDSSVFSDEFFNLIQIHTFSISEDIKMFIFNKSKKNKSFKEKELFNLFYPPDVSEIVDELLYNEFIVRLGNHSSIVEQEFKFIPEKIYLKKNKLKEIEF